MLFFAVNVNVNVIKQHVLNYKYAVSNKIPIQIRKTSPSKWPNCWFLKELKLKDLNLFSEAVVTKNWGHPEQCDQSISEFNGNNNNIWRDVVLSSKLRSKTFIVIRVPQTEKLITYWEKNAHLQSFASYLQICWMSQKLMLKNFMDNI